VRVSNNKLGKSEEKLKKLGKMRITNEPREHK
jgi:hypothetical protein